MHFHGHATNAAVIKIVAFCCIFAFSYEVVALRDRRIKLKCAATALIALLGEMSVF